jgi:integrase
VTRIHVKGFQIFKDRHGKRWRCYHRKTRLTIDLEKAPLGSTEFFAEVARINELAKVAAPPRAGTLGLLIKDYRAHDNFLRLAPRTRSDYQRVFDYLQPIADTPLVKFDAPLVARIRDKAGKSHGRKFGNYVKTVFSILFGFGVEQGHVKSNPAFRMKSIRKPKDAPEANRPWTDAERLEVEAEIAGYPHMRSPMALMMYCGIDPQDALRLPRTAIDDGKMDTKRGKTKVPVWMSLPQPARAVLTAEPKHDAITFCANSRGRPWTVSGFRASWRPIKLKLEKEGRIQPGLTLKGLRHTVGTILAEMGYDDRAIADVLGQETLAMARHYSRRADRGKKVTAIVKKFDVEVNKRRSKIVKPK